MMRGDARKRLETAGAGPVSAADVEAWEETVARAIDGLANYIRDIDGKHEMGAGELAERIIRGWLPPSHLSRAYAAEGAQAVLDAVESNGGRVLPKHWEAIECIAYRSGCKDSAIAARTAAARFGAGTAASQEAGRG